jgi:CDP-diacylglycerol--serine O-phosphatidyltransferase
MKFSTVKLRKFKDPLPLKYLLPNLITIVGLAVGMSSVRFALEGRWEVAVECIIIAAMIDGIDGRIARLLNATSTFGAELDSLCDFANFGVAPSLLIYLWSANQYSYKLLSWGAVLIFIVCMSIRLARFNTSIHDPNYKNSKLAKYFFVGIPAPSGALLALIPIILEFDLAQEFNFTVRPHIGITLIYLTCIGFLMASRIPTLSLKHIAIKPEFIWIILLILGIMIIAAIIYPWYLIPILGVIYLLSIPVTAFIAKKIN